MIRFAFKNINLDFIFSILCMLMRFLLLKLEVVQHFHSSVIYFMLMN